MLVPMVACRRRRGGIHRVDALAAGRGHHKIEPSAVIARRLVAGHSDPALALRIYAQGMGRDEDERSKLRALVEGAGFSRIKSHFAEPDDSASLTADIGTGESA
jgi:hypothetical protein